MRTANIKGVETKMYSIGEVAKCMGLKRPTLLSWLQHRVIPETSRTVKGHRVFTESQMLLLKEVYSKYAVKRGKKMDKVSFSKEIYEKFNS